MRRFPILSGHKLLTNGNGECMRKEEFKAWLIRNNSYSSNKQVADCISRVKRAEECLCSAVPTIKSFDSEFEKDKGSFVRLLLSRRGMTDEMQRYCVNLPIGSNQMDPIAAAVRKYFIFLDSENEE